VHGQTGFVASKKSAFEFQQMLRKVFCSYIHTNESLGEEEYFWLKKLREEKWLMDWRQKS
jgi:hypothetical protein